MLCSQSYLYIAIVGSWIRPFFFLINSAVAKTKCYETDIYVFILVLSLDILIIFYVNIRPLTVCLFLICFLPLILFTLYLGLFSFKIFILSKVILQYWQNICILNYDTKLTVQRLIKVLLTVLTSTILYNKRWVIKGVKYRRGLQKTQLWFKLYYKYAKWVLKQNYKQ